MRGDQLPHGAYFEGESGRTCCYCSMIVPGMSVRPDVPISVTTPSPLRDVGFLEGFD